MKIYKITSVLPKNLSIQTVLQEVKNGNTLEDITAKYRLYRSQLDEFIRQQLTIEELKQLLANTENNRIQKIRKWYKNSPKPIKKFKYR